METITCKNCSEQKPPLLFYQRKSGIYKKVCKRCEANISKARYYSNQLYRINKHRKAKERLQANGYKNMYRKYISKKRLEAKDKYGISPSMYAKYGLGLWLDVMKRYNGACDICKTVEGLTFHHINHLGRGYQERTGNKPDNRLENIQLLCRRCHGSVDGKRAKGIKKPSYEVKKLQKQTSL
jgi:5-methylcytosine-specific restriction endonuclease McrA